jgi:hypothetical protein
MAKSNWHSITNANSDGSIKSRRSFRNGVEANIANTDISADNEPPFDIISTSDTHDSSLFSVNTVSGAALTCMVDTSVVTHERYCRIKSVNVINKTKHLVVVVAVVILTATFPIDHLVNDNGCQCVYNKEKKEKEEETSQQ